MSLIELARQFLFVREVGGQNKGLWVSFFQQYTGNAAGDSWCCSFVCWLLTIHYQGKSPFRKTASCADLLAQCRAFGLESATPVVGGLFFYLDETGHAHHVGIITALLAVTGIAGNTSADGTSDNGDRVAEHGLTVRPGRITYAHVP